MRIVLGEQEQLSLAMARDAGRRVNPHGVLAGRHVYALALAGADPVPAWKVASSQKKTRDQSHSPGSRWRTQAVFCGEPHVRRDFLTLNAYLSLSPPVGVRSRH